VIKINLRWWNRALENLSRKNYLSYCTGIACFKRATQMSSWVFFIY